MTASNGTRRGYGTGALLTHRGAWYGQFRVGGRIVKRKLGAKRRPGSREGLTRKQAEAGLRRVMEETRAAPPLERITLERAGSLYISHLTSMGRKRSTLMDYGSYLRVHLSPFFGEKSIDRIGRDDLEAFMAAKTSEGHAPKSILNYLGLLHSIFTYAEKRGWTNANPCKLIDKPRPDADGRIRFLDQDELEALLRSAPETDLGRTDRTMYLAAAMTGMRQGELLALRWRDVDWLAAKIRVRENYVRGEFGTPKSKRSTRSVPLADRLATDLEFHSQRSNYPDDDDLVFCHPDTGKPMERSRLLKRFKSALKRAQVRPVRFHDLRHTFGTRMAAAGVPMRTLQEWMGHRDFKTTLIYADYAPGEHEAELVERAFGAGINSGINLKASRSKTALNNPH